MKNWLNRFVILAVLGSLLAGALVAGCGDTTTEETTTTTTDSAGNKETTTTKVEKETE